jgi:hypothetical protein
LFTKIATFSLGTNMPNGLDNFLKVALGAGILAAGSGLGYYYGFHLPNVAEREETAKSDRILAARTNYDACLAEAYQVYSNDWDSTCKADKKKSDCLLPDYQFQKANKLHEVRRRECLDIFKAEV